MKKPRNRKTKAEKQGNLLPEYNFDYSKAKPNRFAGRMSEAIAVVLEPDVAAVFKSSKTVNAILRSAISAMSQTKRRKAS